jgi:hypothetical protein
VCRRVTQIFVQEIDRGRGQEVEVVVRRRRVAIAVVVVVRNADVREVARLDIAESLLTR